MKQHHSKGRWFIIVTLMIAIMLDILPLPVWAMWLRPTWTLLVMIYWVMALPDVVGVASAFVMGILLDLLNGSLLGEHALAMVIVAYIVIKLHQLIRVYPLLQQTLIIFLLVLVYQMVVFAVQGAISQLPHTMLYWLTLFVSTLLWPWVFILLRDWRRRLQVC